MQWIELNNVEYGECIVIGGNSQILMVDCGSMNNKLRETDTSLDECFDKIAMQYADFHDRQFLLTHYHRDHLCGFKKILEKYPGYFNKVYIPAAITCGHPYLLDFAVYSYVFQPFQTDLSQVNTSCVKMFDFLDKYVGYENIFTLKAGDIFSFDNVDYEVLWPCNEEFPFSEELVNAVDQVNGYFLSPFLTISEKSFIEIKERFLNCYVNCCEAFSVMSDTIGSRSSVFSELSEALADLEGIKEVIRNSPIAYDILEIIQNPKVSAAYSDCTNFSSLVFQNVRSKNSSGQDILMTGDATPETFSYIWEDLYDSYFILKAPHHGTQSGYSPMFSKITFSHILISNGEYHAGGQISEKYIDMENSIKHCTNSFPCKWFRESGCCCNRFSYCYELKSGAGLAIRCPANFSPKLTDACPGCNIKAKGCFCDL